ncbi:MAG: hypothetical protein EBU97_05325 [Rhodobacteraceae bacterium]|nr:hypothetical protein [Paracoccaceae bacterium]
MHFIAFYWTLPVKWAGFTQLPKTADEAAKASWTIRYQVARVRRWVKDEKGTLLREAVFMDARPDRGTDAIQSEISALLAEAIKKDAELVLVDFAQAFGWRPHGPLFDRIGDAKNCVLLPPEPAVIEGVLYDPVAHFRQWRDIEQARQMDKDDLKQATLATMSGLRAEGASYAAIALRLNDMGVSTINGRAWTADNLRKFMAQG